MFNNTQIMAIMNLTPDSFYANSRMESLQKVVDKAGAFIEEGASIIDIGGQSTRPGAIMISEEEEIERVSGAIESISKVFPTVKVSIDTFQSKVAKAAIEAGATIVNDISCGSFDPEILEVVAQYKAGYIGMHITGTKDTMHVIPERTDIIEELIHFFTQKKQFLADKGIQDWIIDPGFGFGKTIQDNFTIIKDLRKLAIIQLPILIGVSRKSSIYKTLGISAEEALNGTTVVNTIAIKNGASILRVHDVKEARQALTLIEYLQ
jgi:dihydropteroate synthase